MSSVGNFPGRFLTWSLGLAVSCNPTSQSSASCPSHCSTARSLASPPDSPGGAMLLTSRMVRAARPRERRYVLADEHGMSLHVMPRGSKWWRFRYRFCRAERMISLGVYPGVNLAKARVLHADARGLLARDIDPSADRKERRAASAHTFEVVARQWLKLLQPRVAKGQLAADTVKDATRILERDIFPALGTRSIWSALYRRLTASLHAPYICPAVSPRETLNPSELDLAAARQRAAFASRSRPRTDAFHTQGGLSPTWVASRNPPQSCMNGARSRTYRATSRPCCSPTAQARRKWIPTNMRENAFSRAASSTLS